MANLRGNVTIAPDTDVITIKVCDSQGIPGADGKSAYQIAKENNLTQAPNEKEWIEAFNSQLGLADDFLSIYNLAKG